MTTLNLKSAKPTTTRTDVLVVAAADRDGAVELLGAGADVADAFDGDLPAVLATLGFTAATGSVAKVPCGTALKAGLLLVVGVGSSTAPDHEQLRRAAAVAIRAVSNAASVAVAFPGDDDGLLQAAAEGLLLGAYRFERYRGAADRPSKEAPATISLLTSRARQSGATAALERAEIVAEAVTTARDWVNTAPGDLRPPDFAAAATEAASATKIKVTVWDDARLEKEGCGGTLGVGRGSESGSRIVQLSYKPRKAVAHLALVGKGITFDSGGLSLKPGASMTTMKCDMAGAAAVLAATVAIARLGLPVQVTCVAAMAENMPSGSATRPGDVLTIRGGTTVEVHNTDAEGRLVLADGLVLAGEAGPDVLIDAATLTGAAVVALGDRTAAVLSNDDVLRERIPAIAGSVGESMWPLPITEEMRPKVRSSELADLRQHNPKPVAGTLYAAAFLREFVGDHRWAHLDIAGPAFNGDGAYDYTPTGGTGAGVRTLVAIAQAMADGELG